MLGVLAPPMRIVSSVYRVKSILRSGYGLRTSTPFSVTAFAAAEQNQPPLALPRHAKMLSRATTPCRTPNSGMSGGPSMMPVTSSGRASTISWANVPR